MQGLARILIALAVASVALAPDMAEAAKKKATRKFTPARKQAVMQRARALCMESKTRRGGQLIRVEITDEGKLWCWYR